MKTFFPALPVAALVLAATLIPSSPASAVINLPPEKTKIYETPGDGLSFPGWPSIPTLPGHTVGEARDAGGGSADGDKGGDSSGGGDKTSNPKRKFVNPRLGMRDAPRDVQLQVFSRGKEGDSFDTITLTSTKDFSYIAKVEPLTTYNSDGTSTQTGVTLEFRVDVLSSQADIAKAIFGRSGSTFTSCDALDMTFVCTLKTPRRVAASPTPFVADLIGDVSDRQIPLCSGIVVDGGYGTQTVISPADVSCEAAPEKEPVRLEIETILGGVESDFPVVRAGDGSIVYSPPLSAEGTYTAMRVWAISADGTTSWPFYVAIRNRYAPKALSPGTVEAMRSVDTAIPQASLFSDVDVDHAPESGDRLESSVTSQGAMGAAWFDSAGSLHYRSIDIIHGEYTDHVTVKTTDRYGLGSAERVIDIHIDDVAPGCASDGATTDANTPVRIQFACWITPPAAGWTQVGGLTYELTSQPAHGTVSDLDPVSGSAIYTPDPEHPGPVSIRFSASNNGAVRSGSFAVDVHDIP